MYGGYDGQGLVDAYEKQTGKQYVPPLGYDDASYDVMLNAIERAGTKDRDAVLKALGATDLDTVVKTTEWITEVLSITGLRPHADTLAGRLALLLRKRHELARALAMRPKLLLIDEVAAGLT